MKKKLSILLSLAFVVGICCVPAMAIKSVTQYEPEDILSEEQIQREQVSGWAKDVVNTAKALGMIPAFTDNPAFTGTITREQFAELVVKMVETVLGEEMEAASPDTFSDTTNPAVLKACQAGIIAGVGDGKFAPKLSTNREQIATMIDRAAQYLSAKLGENLTPNVGNMEVFSDRGDISIWAAASMAALVGNGIMSGTSATTIAPKDTCTVEQSILMVYRVYEKA